MLLPVSAPFHSSLMRPAADVMAQALADVSMTAPEIPLVANVRAVAVDVNDIKTLLVEQITGSVRWRESVIWMSGAGVTEVWEIGAGKALTGMVKRIDRSIATRTIGTPGDVVAAAAVLNEG
jgi:[acyl-carrier-protein] S-malonyltransferase